MGNSIKEAARAQEHEPLSVSALIHREIRVAIETAVHEELRAVKIPVLRCMVSQDQDEPTTVVAPYGWVSSVVATPDTVRPCRDTLRHSQCSPCYVVQDG